MDKTIATDPPVTWLTTDWQPAWIYEGPLQGQGYAQSIERLLKQKLTGFEHKSQRIINVRTYSILKNSDACFAASSYQGADLTDKQREGLIWSAPTFLFFYHGIIMHHAALSEFGQHIEDNYVNLTSLVADAEIVGLYQPGRRYSRWIMPILEGAVHRPNMLRWSSNSQLTQGVFKMLEANRIDYFIDYGFLKKFHEQTAIPKSQLLYLPIVEHRDTVGLGAIACNATPVGYRVIEKINALLLNIRDSEVYKKTASRWLIPEGMEQKYWQLWKNELLTKTR